MSTPLLRGVPSDVGVDFGRDDKGRKAYQKMWGALDDAVSHAALTTTLPDMPSQPSTGLALSTNREGNRPIGGMSWPPGISRPPGSQKKSRSWVTISRAAGPRPARGQWGRFWAEERSRWHVSRVKATTDEEEQCALFFLYAGSSSLPV